MNPDFASSDIFELIADNGARFFVHKDILACQSQPFREAIEGPWKEATDRKVNLSDWDEKTISRMVQFLYVRNYEYPDPTPLFPLEAGRRKIKKDPPPEDPGRVIPVVEPDPVVKVPQPPINRPLTPIQEYLPTYQHGSITGTARLAWFGPAKHDFEEVLLAHAKIYALAHYKSIDALQKLAIGYLIMTLSHLSPITPDSHIPKNIISLATYVYANTNSPTGSEEPLRRVVSQFIALSLTGLYRELEAVGLIEKGGDFTKDLMAKACRRIAAVPYSYVRFISGCRVIKAKNSYAPTDCVKEVYKSSSNLCYRNYVYKWLAPEYTTIAKDACTGFRISCSGGGRPDDCIISAYYTHYLEEIKDQRIMEKVIEVALVRSKKRVDLDSVLGYDGITTSIHHALVDQGESQGQDGSQDYLHLVWKSVKVSLA